MNNKYTQAALALLGLIFVFVLVVLAPFTVVLALNVLFSSGITYSIWTWLATVWLVVVIRGITSKN